MTKKLPTVILRTKLTRWYTTEAVENNKRADGRGMDEVRPLYAQAGNMSARLARQWDILSRRHPCIHRTNTRQPG